MKIHKRSLYLLCQMAFGSLLFACIAAPLPAQQSDPFYISLLEKAQKSFLAKNYEEAARDFDIAIFGLGADKALKAKAHIYLSLCRYYLKDLKSSEKSLREAAAIVGEEGFSSLQIYESSWTDLEKLMTFFNIGQAQNSPLPAEVAKPVPNDPQPPPGGKPNPAAKKPDEKSVKEQSQGREPTPGAQSPPESGLTYNEIKEGDIVALDLVDTPPVVITRIPASYPPNVGATSIEGTVLVNALISEKGDVIKTEIIKGMKDAFGFDQAAQRAVRRWKFEPASIKGIHIKVWVPIAIEFKKEPGS